MMMNKIKKREERRESWDELRDEREKNEGDAETKGS
jgi:hypothetical protein